MAVPRWVKRLGIMVGVLAFGIALFYAEEDWRGAREWSQAETELKAKGEPLTMEEVVPPPVPDDQNVAAAPIFAELFQKDAEEARLSRFKGVFSRKDGAPLPSLRLLESAKEPDFPGWNKRLTGKENSSPALGVVQALKSYDPFLEEVSSALERPVVRWQTAGSNNPLQESRPYLVPVLNLCRFLQLRAIAEVEMGQPDAALSDVDLGFRIAEIPERGGGAVIDYAVETSSQALLLSAMAYGLEKRVWNAEQLQRLQSMLERLNPLKTLKDASRRERCAALSLFRLPIADQYKSMQAGIDSGFEKVTWRERLAVKLYRIRPSGWGDLDRAAFARQVQAERIDSIDADRGTGKISLLLWHGEWTFWAMLVRPGTAPSPQFLSVLRKGWMVQAYVAEARIACALERFRLQNGALPDSLDALVPEFLSGLPPDPVTGGPLLYGRIEDGYVVYSVGTDEKDDAGAIDQQNKDRGDWVWASRPDLYKFLPAKAP